MATEQRVNFVVIIIGDSNLQLVLAPREGDKPLMRFEVEGLHREVGLAPLQPLPANPLSPIGSLENVAVTELLMQGGAMGRMQSATY
mgnify:CR=1 FL=1